MLITSTHSPFPKGSGNVGGLNKTIAFPIDYQLFYLTAATMFYSTAGVDRNEGFVHSMPELISNELRQNQVILAKVYDGRAYVPFL